MKNKQTFSITETAEILVPDKLGRTSYLLALVLMLMMSGIISLILGKLPLTVPLYFSLPWGETRLAPRMMLFSMPLIVLLVILINWGLGRVATKLSPLLPRVLAVTSAVVSLMMMLSLIGIIQSLIL